MTIIIKVEAKSEEEIKEISLIAQQLYRAKQNFSLQEINERYFLFVDGEVLISDAGSLKEIREKYNNFYEE